MINRVKWGNGVVLIRCSEDSLILTFKNVKITLYPREVQVNRGVLRFFESTVGKKRYVYVYFREKLKPIITNDITNARNTRVQCNFEVHCVDLEFSKYLTIVTPGATLYNYVVFTEDIMTIVSSGKRKVYFETIDGGLNVYYK